VLVTRPAHQAEHFCKLLAAAGAEPIRLPCIEIVPPRNPAGARAAIARCASADLLIFVSSNAVCGAHALRPMPWTDVPSAHIAAIGKATADSLATHGMPVGIVPAQGFDSESLLATPQLANARNKSVIILRGASGRELLRDKLTFLGASVTYVETYRQRRPDLDATAVDRALAPDGANVVAITSDAGLENLLELATAKHADALRALPLVVNSQRNAQRARALGFNQTVLVPSLPGDQGQLEALIDWHSNRNRQ
jgi:uroporphyrinogen-III synthase